MSESQERPGSEQPDDAAARREARKRRRRERRQRVILDQARQLLAETGLDGLTVAAVAEAAQVSKPSVYYYFDSKESLVAGVALDCMEAETAAMEAAVAAAETGVDALAALIRARMEHFTGDLTAYRLIYWWPVITQVPGGGLLETSYAVSDRVNRAIVAKLEADRRAGRLHPDVHPRRLANVAWAASQGLLAIASSLETLGGRLRFRLDELTDEACGAVRRAALA